jgi:N-acetylneuraminic acid mutarotase
MRIFLIILLLLSCSKNPIEKGNESDALKVNYSFVRSVSETTADLIWECSSPSYGIITYGNIGFENVQFVFIKQKIQFYKLTSLGAGKTHNYQVGCIGERKAVYFIQKFQTLPTPQPLITQTVMNRGIWIVGGVGSSNTPVGQIDLYDPVGDKWYSSVTTIPTPRSYTGVVALNNKIYVIGGMLLDANGNSTVSNAVEEYSPYPNTWKTLASIPVSIQGALASVSGNSIYLIGGSISSSSASAIPNIVYKFTPDAGTGTWVTITSNSTIVARTDLSGCSIDGTIFFNSGRDTTGSPQFTNDAYISSANSTTGITEGNFSLARFGTSSTCYRPKSTDAFPSDSPGIFLAGGSTLSNTSQPPSALLATNRFDYYLTPSTANTVLTGPSLPINLYAPAAEVSYDLRRLYVFGGATIVNVPTSTVYWIDLSSPSTGPWNTLTTTLPTPRFGHSAILINR